MRLYLKIVLILFLLAVASIKLMLATDNTNETNFENKDLNKNGNGNYRQFRPEAGITTGMGKLSTTTFSFEDNSCYMLY